MPPHHQYIAELELLGVRPAQRDAWTPGTAQLAAAKIREVGLEGECNGRSRSELHTVWQA
jgi:hypothetical protein